MTVLLAVDVAAFSIAAVVASVVAGLSTMLGYWLGRRDTREAAPLVTPDPGGGRADPAAVDARVRAAVDALPPSAGLRVEWTRSADEHGRPVVLATVIAKEGETQTRIESDELRSEPSVRVRFLIAWSDILRAESDRRLENMARMWG